VLRFVGIELPVQMFQFSNSFSIPLAVMVFENTVDFVSNHIRILGSWVTDEINACLGEGYCGGIDLSEYQRSVFI